MRQDCQRRIWYSLYAWHYIVLAHDQGRKATHEISTFTPSKIDLRPQKNFLSDRYEQDLSIALLEIRIGHDGKHGDIFPHSLD